MKNIFLSGVMHSWHNQWSIFIEILNGVHHYDLNIYEKYFFIRVMHSWHNQWSIFTETLNGVHHPYDLYGTVNKISRVGKLLFKDELAVLVLFKKPWPNQRRGKGRR